MARRGLIIGVVAWVLCAAAPASATAPSLFCHQVDAVNGPVSVPAIETVDAFGTTDTSIQRTAHVCTATTVDGIPSAVPDYQATTFELAAGTPPIDVGDFKVTTQFGPVFIRPLYADILLTSAAIGSGTLPDPPADSAAWTCYRIEYPAFPNFFVPISDPFRPEKIIRIRKPRLLCLPSMLDGVPPPDPDALITCYRQVSRLPAPPQPTVPGLLVQGPFAVEVLDANKDDLVCLPATAVPSAPGSAGERLLDSSARSD
jgi:hypothetical protein